MACWESVCEQRFFLWPLRRSLSPVAQNLLHQRSNLRSTIRASPSIVDDLIAVPVWEKCLGAEQLSSMVFVSSNGRLEIYAHGSAGLEAAFFAQLIESRARLAVPVFPNGARLGKVDDVSGSPFPPAIVIRDIDTVQVTFDPKRRSRSLFQFAMRRRRSQGDNCNTSDGQLRDTPEGTGRQIAGRQNLSPCGSSGDQDRPRA